MKKIDFAPNMNCRYLLNPTIWAVLTSTHVFDRFKKNTVDCIKISSGSLLHGCARMMLNMMCVNGHYLNYWSIMHLFI